jgi:hypothetical protein
MSHVLSSIGRASPTTPSVDPLTGTYSLTELPFVHKLAVGFGPVVATLLAAEHAVPRRTVPLSRGK